MRARTIVAALSAALVVTPAAAAESWDSTTGTGQVSKGQIQSAFGWNDGEFQSRASDISFTADVITAHPWDCVDARGIVVGGGVVFEDGSFVFVTDLFGPLDSTVSVVRNPKGKVLRFRFSGFGMGIPGGHWFKGFGHCAAGESAVPGPETTTVYLFARVAPSGEPRLVLAATR